MRPGLQMCPPEPRPLTFSCATRKRGMVPMQEGLLARKGGHRGPSQRPQLCCAGHATGGAPCQHCAGAFFPTSG